MIIRKLPYILIILLTLFSLAIRLYRLTEPPKYYFDEVYHAVTAKGYADNNSAAYDPFAPAPKEGTAYDWLHPPLAKLIQAGSIKIFGDFPFAWRFPSLIFGTAIIPATFILGLVLFGPTVAIFASATIAFENLNFVMSRITMNDVFLTFFVVTSLIFLSIYLRFYKTKYLILTAIFLGLAVGSKWTGVYALLVVAAVTLFAQLKHKRLSLNILFLVFIPPVMYLASYGQFWLQGYTVRNFIDLHKQIWWYQNRHDLKHSYGTTPLYCVPEGLNGQKKWCPWVLDVRGVYFSYEEYEHGKAGYIYALGNPLIFWAGIIAVSYAIGKYLDNRDKKLLLIIISYAIFWVPWIFSPRIMFLYHYLPAIPFLAISLGIALGDIFRTRLKYLSVLILISFIVLFFYFYPISSGWPIPVGDIDKYMWIKSWR